MSDSLSYRLCGTAGGAAGGRWRLPCVPRPSGHVGTTSFVAITMASKRFVHRSIARSSAAVGSARSSLIQSMCAPTSLRPPAAPQRWWEKADRRPPLAAWSSASHEESFVFLCALLVPSLNSMALSARALHTQLHTHNAFTHLVIVIGELDPVPCVGRRGVKVPPGLIEGSGRWCRQQAAEGDRRPFVVWFLWYFFCCVLLACWPRPRPTPAQPVLVFAFHC